MAPTLVLLTRLARPMTTCTRSIKLKLVVPRASEHADIAKALWATHVAINTACRYYEEQLVRMRGAAYG
jgi:hypothetical protein